jgi:hypothetical protein
MLEFSPQVTHVCLSLSLKVEDVSDMVKKAAVLTHERGNRRFHGWIFEVKGDRVSRMSQLDDVVVYRKGSQALTVHEECPDCLGLSCAKCGWAGEVKVEYS